MKAIDMIRSLNAPKKLIFENIKWKEDDDTEDYWTCEFNVKGYDRAFLMVYDTDTKAMAELFVSIKKNIEEDPDSNKDYADEITNDDALIPILLKEAQGFPK
jgi:Cu2+-containing amine oxidase